MKKIALFISLLSLASVAQTTLPKGTICALYQDTNGQEVLTCNGVKQQGIPALNVQPNVNDETGVTQILTALRLQNNLRTVSTAIGSTGVISFLEQE